jgi:D-sedoheptulose 7-phosphate isomerase
MAWEAGKLNTALPRDMESRYICSMETDVPTVALDLKAFLSQEAAEHREAFESLLRGYENPFSQILSIWEHSIRAGGKLLLFGNGGSASDAQHIAAELVIRYHTDRDAIAAIALTTDTSALTAGSNDHGFESIFSRQVEALGRPGDVVLGISTSGRSRNVVNGLREARSRRLQTTGLIGGDGGEMRALCDAAIIVPSSITARIQEMHIYIGHLLCKALEMRLGLVG